ncbi:MAG: hypothetical protein ACR2MX_08950 [Cyclobacteriaceae bacterium]
MISRKYRGYPQCIISFCTIVILLNCINVSAQNNERKGFILGFGVGAGLNSYQFDFELSGIDFMRESKVAFVTDFRIGYAPTDQIAIYWVSRGSWYNQEGVFSLGGDKVFVINGMAGLGGSYYLEPEAPCFFVNAAVGYANWFTPFEDNPENNLGFGVGLGGGYEFSKHWSAELNLTGGKPSGDDGFSVNTWAARLTINYLMY